MEEKTFQKHEMQFFKRNNEDGNEKPHSENVEMQNLYQPSLENQPQQIKGRCEFMLISKSFAISFVPASQVTLKLRA